MKTITKARSAERPPRESTFLILGDWAGLFITGGHGGTVAEERLATVVSFAVNTAVYSLLGVAIIVQASPS